MATEPLPHSIPKQPTTIRFPEEMRLAGERIAAETGKSFAQLVRDAVAAMIRTETNRTQKSETLS